MSLLNNLSKSVKSHHLLILLGLIVLGVALVQYSGKKSVLLSGMSNAENNEKEAKDIAIQRSGYSAAGPVGTNSGPATISGMNSQAVASSCTSKPVVNPSDLLPSDSNNEWAKLNPSADLKNVNLLSAGHHTGINTVGGSLRNANLQVRSEPPNPRTDVGPWQNTTIEPDLTRLPFEIGCGKQ